METHTSGTGRVIKFRAWDGKRIWTPKRLDLFDWRGVPTALADEVEATLMQFTGLHDKNGKEIYEGDILNLDPHELPLVVRFRGDVCAFEANEPRSNRWERLSPNFSHRFAVIGDIYSNPELICDHDWVAQITGEPEDIEGCRKCLTTRTV